MSLLVSVVVYVGECTDRQQPNEEGLLLAGLKDGKVSRTEREVCLWKESLFPSSGLSLIDQPARVDNILALSKMTARVNKARVLTRSS